jgi:hypothetical protein
MRHRVRADGRCPRVVHASRAVDSYRGCRFSWRRRQVLPNGCGKAPVLDSRRARPAVASAAVAVLGEPRLIHPAVCGPFDRGQLSQRSSVGCLWNRRQRLRKSGPRHGGDGFLVADSFAVKETNTEINVAMLRKLEARWRRPGRSDANRWRMQTFLNRRGAASGHRSPFRVRAD